MLRLGLIGAGPWGRRIIETVGRLDDLGLARVASRNPETPGLVSCPVETDWRAVVAAEDVDALVVTTPPDRHAEMAVAAIEAGKPVLVEKPLTLDVAEARELLARAEACGACVLVDHIHLFSAPFHELRRRAADLGPLRRIRGEGGNWGPFREDTPPLWDYGAHDLAMCLALLGEVPDRVGAARRDRQRTEQGVGELWDVHLDFPGGAEADITVGNIMTPKRRRFAVDLDGGRLVYDDLAEHRLTEVRDGKDRPWDPGTIRLPLDTALMELARAARRGGADTDGLRLGVQVVEILAQCQDPRSWRTA